MRGLTWVMRAEFAKVLRRNVTLGTLALGVIVAVATVLLQGFSAKIVELEGHGAISSLNGFELYATALRYGVTAGAIPLLVLAGITVAEEFELGTAKILFSKPVTRGAVIGAKGLVLCLLAVTLVLTVAGASAATVALTNGFTDVIDPTTGVVMNTIGPDPSPLDGLTYAMPKNLATATALLIPPLAAVLLIALALSAITRDAGAAVGTCFGAIIGIAALATFWRDGRMWLVTESLQYPTDVLKDLAVGISRASFYSKKGIPRMLLAIVSSIGTGLFAWLVAGLVTWRRQVLGWLLAALVPALALGGAAPARADSPPSFKITQHRIAGQVSSMRITDMDGDDRSDLVVFVTQGAHGPAAKRFLAIFYQREGGVFEREPDQVLEVPGPVVAKLIGNLDRRHPGYEIGYLTTKGLLIYHAVDRVYQPVPHLAFEESSLFDMSSDSDLPSWDSGCQDVDGDGDEDVLVMRKGDAVLYLQQTDGTFEKRATFPLSYEQRFGNRFETVLLRRFLSFSGKLGRPVLSDVSGDGKLDLVTLRDTKLEVYEQGKPGVFPKDPSWAAPLGSLIDENEEDSLNQLSSDLVDVDGDNKADLILFRNLGKVGVFESLRTQVLFYRAQPRWKTDTPTQVINLNGLSMSPALIDIDGDGDRDLVLSSLRTDMISNVGTALFESVTISYHVFLFDKKAGRFATSPDFSRDLDIDVGRVEGGGTVPLAYFWGDYTGDGKRDLLTLDRADRLTIYPLRIKEGGLFSAGGLDFPEDEKTEVRLQTSNSNKIQDINWDGRHDMVFWYWDDSGESKEKGVITVVMSQGK